MREKEVLEAAEEYARTESIAPLLKALRVKVWILSEDEEKSDSDESQVLFNALRTQNLLLDPELVPLCSFS